MAELSITVIDVGWGDSILVDSQNDAGDHKFGLVDCNDFERQRNALPFVKRYLERLSIDWKDRQPLFEWVLLTHGHADHARGLKEMLKTFGTRHFWYPKSVASTTYGVLLDFANRSDAVVNHQAVDETKILAAPEVEFHADLRVLWPNFNQVDINNENNNSVVLALSLGDVTMVLTGDAEAENWPQIVPRLPANTTHLQVPHHGGRNGLFDPSDATPLLDPFGDEQSCGASRPSSSRRGQPAGQPALCFLSNRSQLPRDPDHRREAGLGGLHPCERSSSPVS
jgi:beta-lactamase superfamily II metal-dependent hydrolase